MKTTLQIFYSIVLSIGLFLTSGDCIGNDYRSNRPSSTPQCAAATSHAPPYYYKTVTKYLPQRIAYQKKVVRYRSCGTPYYTWISDYKTAEIPVRVKVKVYHRR